MFAHITIKIVPHSNGNSNENDNKLKEIDTVKSILFQRDRYCVPAF